MKKHEQSLPETHSLKIGISPEIISIVINRKGQGKEDSPYFFLLRALPTKTTPDLIQEANHACLIAIQANYHRKQGMGGAAIMNMDLFKPFVNK